MLVINTILHPTDFSDDSDAAFRVACAVARDHGARLIVMHAARGPVVGPLCEVLPPSPETYREELTEKLNSLCASAHQIETEQQLLLNEDAGGAVLQVAVDERCDLIVMGTHGRSGLSRMLLGSVAEQVVRRSPCPVLTVKLPPRQSPRSEALTPSATAAK